MTFRTRLRFIFRMTGRHLITNSWDFPDDRSRFCYEQLRFSWWPLRKKCPYSELFWSVFFGIRTEYGPEWKTPITGTFHAVDRSRFSWQVKIFMTIGQDFKIVSIAIVIEVVWFQRCFQWWNFWHNLIEYPFFNLSSKLIFWKCVTYIGGVALILSKGH